MRKIFLTVLTCLLGTSASCAAPAATTETIILIRHGEKPKGGMGQLSCRGLNRSLKLPAVIAKDFGKPDAIFAPDPAKEKKDSGISYAYNRPLATVEPTAIRFQMPVDTRFGYDEIGKLQVALEQLQYSNATILVGWEHKQLYKLARNRSRTMAEIKLRCRNGAAMISTASMCAAYPARRRAHDCLFRAPQ